MKPHTEEQKLTEPRSKPAKPRFHIEKLEERIAPAKGGIQGKPPGDGYCYWYCDKPGRRAGHNKPQDIP